MAATSGSAIAKKRSSSSEPFATRVFSDSPPASSSTSASRSRWLSRPSAAATPGMSRPRSSSYSRRRVAVSAEDRAPRRGPRPSVGGEVGYSRSDLGGSDAQRVQSRQGALTGVYMQLPLAGPLSIRPEILFALKGGRVQADVEGGGTVEL